MAQILLAFDDEAENPLLCELLERLGHRCIGVRTGEGALSLLPTQRPDLILLGLMLPDIDGLEVLRRIRANPDTAGLPVIMFSGIGDSEFAKLLRKRGASDYWIKGAMDLIRLNEMIAMQVGS
jgi:DNA-binding response OmpR family regulator